MKYSYRVRPALLHSLLLVLGTSSVFAQSQNDHSIVVIPESVRPIEAIVIPTQPSEERAALTHKPVEVVNTGQPGQTLRILVDPQEAASGALVTVIGRDAGGETYASPLQSMNEAESQVQAIAASCRPGEVRKSLVGLPEESLKKLIEIREKKNRELLRRLTGDLTPELFASFRQQEKRYGLSYTSELDEKLGAQELVARLVRITALAGLTPTDSGLSPRK